MHLYSTGNLKGAQHGAVLHHVLLHCYQIAMKTLQQTDQWLLYSEGC